MDKKLVIIIISLSVLIAAVILSLVLQISKPNLSPQRELETCKSLYYNGESGINIVVFSDAKTAKIYADNLLSTSPLSGRKNAFNFYYIDSYKPECELYQGVALLCYSRELIKKASSCPNDYIVVVQEYDAKIRSSAYMNVISLNSRLPKTVFAHEFGHVFANLADEYSPSAIVRGSTNCASDCSKFGSNCFQGCSKDNYYRSINLGLMRTLNSNTFGEFDEGLIADRISKQANIITAKAISEEISCENDRYYLIEGNYSNGSIKILSKNIEQGCLGSNGVGPFNYTIILEDNSRKFQGEFNAELIFTDAQAEQEESINGEALANGGIFLLKIPVIDNAKSIELSTESSTTEVSLVGKGARPCEII